MFTRRRGSESAGSGFAAHFGEDSPEAVKERHDSEVRRAVIYNNIKKLAFGNKYKVRTGLDKPKKVKRTKEASPLELSLRPFTSSSSRRKSRSRSAASERAAEEL